MSKKPNILNVLAGFLSAKTINENFTRIADAFDNTLSRDGSLPNHMNADIDMNSNDILNVNKISVEELKIDNQDPVNLKNWAKEAEHWSKISEDSAVKARDSAFEASMYDGPRVERLDDLPSVRSDQVGVFHRIRVDEVPTVLIRAEDTAGNADWDFTSTGGVKFYNIREPDIGNVVVYGSSTLAGFGIDDFVPPLAENGWSSDPSTLTGILVSKIGERGKVINRSEGGIHMQHLLDNFGKAVAPYKPRFVITGTGWVNQPGPTPSEKASGYIERATSLVSMCRAIGAEPIFAAFNPIDAFSLPVRQAQKDAKDALSELGVRVWDLCGSAGNPDYTFRPGLNSDNIHANAAGYLRFAEQINMDDFYAGAPVQAYTPPKVRYVSGPISGGTPLHVRLRDESACNSWTVAARMKNVRCTEGTAGLLYFNSSNDGHNLRLRWAGNSMRLTYDDVDLIVSSLMPLTDFNDHLHVISYNSVSRMYSWWIDGVLVGTGAAPTTTERNLQAVSFGVNAGTTFFPATGYGISNLLIWRNSFPDSSRITEMNSGLFPTESLHVDVDFTRTYVGSPANRASLPCLIAINGGTYESV